MPRLTAVAVVALLVASAVGATTASAQSFGLERERLGVRDGAGGVVVRLYLGSLPAPPDEAGCFPEREVVAQVSTRQVAGEISLIGGSGDPFAPAGLIAGEREGHPIAVVVGRVSEGAREVTMRFDGGRTDSMRPFADGWIALAAPLRSVPGRDRPVPLLTEIPPALGRLTVTGRDGSEEQTTITLGGAGFQPPQECFGSESTGGVPLVIVPPTLPEPTGPPPADADAARAEIEASYRAVFEGERTGQASSANLEGAPLLTKRQRRELERGYGDIIGKLTLRVNDFRFLDETEAAISFDLLLDGQPITATTIGRAVLHRGHWKVARETFCEVVGRSGLTCRPEREQSGPSKGSRARQEITVLVLDVAGTPAAATVANTLRGLGYAIARTGAAPGGAATSVACQEGFAAEARRLADDLDRGDVETTPFPEPVPAGGANAICIVTVG